MNIVLIGMRGAGKSGVGQILAKKLQYQFVDTDQLVLERIGIPLSEFVTSEGWPAFREIESDVIKEITAKQKVVIATGGGAVLNQENVKRLQTNGFIVLLKAPLKILAQRIEAGSQDRPSLTQAPSTQEDLAKVWQDRKALYYKCAQVIIDTDNKQTADAAEEIIKALDSTT